METHQTLVSTTRRATVEETSDARLVPARAKTRSSEDRDKLAGNPELQADLKAWREANGNPTNADLAAKIGISRTAISKWVNSTEDHKVFEGNLEEVETRVRSFLRSQENKAQAPRVSGNILQTVPYLLVRSALEAIERTSDFGIISGPAGIGKTICAEEFCRENPTAMMVTVMDGCHTGYGAREQVLEALPERGAHDKHTNHFICKCMRQTPRLLIVDDADELTQSGLRWYFNLHNKTGIPIAMIANPAIENNIRGVSRAERERHVQWVSRVGYNETLKQASFAAEHVEDFVHLFLAEPSAELLIHASRIAAAPGHLRALKKHLNLALVYMDADKKLTDVKAFRYAHAKLMSDCDLSDEI